MNLQIFAWCLLVLAWRPSTVECIFNRQTWGARSTAGRLTRFEGSSNLVVVHQTNSDMCNIPTQCKRIVRDLQINALAINHPDIGYNFLIGCCNGVYEGTGWDYKSPASYDYVNNSIHVALIGKFDTGQEVPVHMGQSMRSLMSEALLRNKLKKPYIITEHKSHPRARNLMLKNFLQDFAEYEEDSSEFLAPSGSRSGSRSSTPPSTSAQSTTASRPQIGGGAATSSTPKPNAKPTAALHATTASSVTTRPAAKPQ